MRNIRNGKGKPVEKKKKNYCEFKFKAHGAYFGNRNSCIGFLFTLTTNFYRSNAFHLFFIKCSENFYNFNPKLFLELNIKDRKKGKQRE